MSKRSRSASNRCSSMRPEAMPAPTMTSFSFLFILILLRRSQLERAVADHSRQDLCQSWKCNTLQSGSLPRSTVRKNDKAGLLAMGADGAENLCMQQQRYC